MKRNTILSLIALIAAVAGIAAAVILFLQKKRCDLLTDIDDDFDDIEDERIGHPGGRIRGNRLLCRLCRLRRKLL